MCDAKKGSFHPITIITLPDKDQQRIACKALLDQCCTNKGLISWDLKKTLGHSTSKGDEKTFTTAAEIFTSDKVLCMTGAMLHCLSTTCMFSIELMVEPKQCSLDLNYGKIIGQETMILLDMDMSVHDITIFWGEEHISLVPCDLWATECIMPQTSCVNKQPQTRNDDNMMICGETFTFEALNPVRYVKADLKQIIQGCTDLTMGHQSKLLLVLKEHKTLFLSNL